MELPDPGSRTIHKTTRHRVSTSFYILREGTNELFIYGFHTLGLFLSLAFSFFLLDRAFQEFENLTTATLEHNRNYLSDSYGDFLFNNEEYLWTPVRTYYKKRLL